MAEFLSAVKIPVATRFKAKGTVPVDHALHLGPFGLPQKDHVDTVIEKADLLLMIGPDPVECSFAKLSRGRTPIVSVAETPLLKDLGIPIAAEVVGALPSTLRALSVGTKTHPSSMWEGASPCEARCSLHALTKRVV
ncbi:hypothetical protein [Thalassococcus sp. S3]|uniref:hypothetical protein n=1 Tax=Thalassococcus sp. S3 TaxID=2017482 RepID=UPI0013EEE6AF|nr:hypothetical protein [Thalassococcus sp. S3]